MSNTTSALAGLEDVRAEVKRREALPHQIEAERVQLQGELLMARQRRHDAQQAAKGKLPADQAERLRAAVVDLERQFDVDWGERLHAARLVAADAPALERDYIDRHLDQLVAELRAEGDQARDRLRAAIDELIAADRHYNAIAAAWMPILRAAQRRDGPVPNESSRGALGTAPIPVVDPGRNRRRYLSREWLRFRDAVSVLLGIFSDGLPSPTPAALEVTTTREADDATLARAA